MHDATDLELLRAYQQHGAEAAFATLVERHVSLVYSVALRHTGSAASAEEITQAVFIILSRKAASLRADTVLEGWLHATARLTALSFLRGERRRQFREQEAYMQSTLHDPATANAWPQLAPLLDEALAQLGTKDRDAVMLRFFKTHSVRDVATALNVNESAAQRRLLRAVEKLRKFFTKRGVTLSATVLTAAIAANSVQAAPAGLAATVTAAALSGASLTSSTLLAATKTITMTTLQKTIVTATVAVLAGAGIYEAKQAANARAEVQILQQAQTPLAIEVARLREEDTQLSNLLAQAKEQKQLTQAQFKELLKLRGQVGVRRLNNEVENSPEFQQAQVWLAKEKKIREQFELHPEQQIPEMQFLKDEEWLDHARHADVDTANGMRCALSNIRAVAGGAFAFKLTVALGAYMAANQQQLPSSASQLAGYFHPPLKDADALLSRYVLAKPNPDVTTQPVVFEQDSGTLIDPIDQRIAIGTNTTIWLPGLQSAPLPDELQPLATAYSDAKHYSFLSVYDLKPYAATPEQKAALDKFILSLTPTR